MRKRVSLLLIVVVAATAQWGCGAARPIAETERPTQASEAYDWLEQGYCSWGMTSEDEAVESQGYTFVVDGTPCVPALAFSTDESRPLTEGDFVYIGAHRYMVGSPGEYWFDTRGQEHGDLYELVGGRAVQRSASVDSRRNPLASMSEQEIRDLHEITVFAWTASVQEDIAKADPATTFFELKTLSTTATVYFADGSQHIQMGGDDGPPPVLPQGLRYLYIDEQTFGDHTQFEYLSTQTDLLYFRIGGYGIKTFDIGVMQDAVNLTHLSLGRVPLTNHAAMATFTSLRTLNLSDQKGFSDVSFLKGLKNLRELYLNDTISLTDISAISELKELRTLVISNTDIKDIGVIRKLPNLKVLDVTQTPASGLPAMQLPSLQRVYALGSNLGEEPVDKFRKLNPQCRVVYGFERSLRDSLQGADVLVIDVTARNAEHLDDREVLFEIKDPRKIADIINMIEIDDCSSTDHCKCIGSPWLTFYRGREEMAKVSMHHGIALRWSGWPADGILTDESAEKINNWLASIGAPGPKKEWQRQMAEKGEQDALEQFYENVLPAEIYAAIRDFERKIEAAERGRGTLSESEGMAMLAAFQKGSPLLSGLKIDDEQAVHFYLTAFGANRGSWGDMDLFVGIIGQFVLPSFADNSSPFLNACVNSGDKACDGFARWLFGGGNWQKIDAADLEQVLMPLWGAISDHPHVATRRVTMAALGKIGSTTAIQILRKVVTDNAVSSSMDEEEKQDQARALGRLSVEPGATVEASDSAYAALVLATAGDKGSLPLIEALHTKAKSELDKAVIAEAIAQLK